MNLPGPFSRTELLLGPEALERLRSARVAVFGLGGVGGFAVEGLARCGVGHLVLVDHDTVSLTNLNRQIIATHRTVGRPKVEVMAERVRDINPEAEVVLRKDFYGPGLADSFLEGLDYVVDAIDTVTCKLDLITACQERGIPVISAMGAGNRLDPTALEVADISKTTLCPLARTMRKELRKRGVRHVKVVYSREEALEPKVHLTEQGTARRQLPGSVAFVPSVMGLILAGEVVQDLIKAPDAGCSHHG